MRMSTVLPLISALFVCSSACSSGSPEDATADESSLDSPATVHLIDANSGKCLDVAAGGTADGTNVQIWTCNGTRGQSFQQVGNTLVNVNSGKCLDVAGGGTADLTNIQIWTCNGTGAQSFQWNGSALVNTQSGKCVDVSGWRTADGSNVALWTCNGLKNQSWKVVADSTSTTTATPPPSTTTTSPAPTPAPSTGTTTTIDQAIADMSSSSEALPINPDFNWMYKPVITQYSAAGSSIASWWTGERPTWCYGLLSWYTLFEAQGNQATNTRVEVKNLRVYTLSNSTRQWTRFDLSVAPNTGEWAYPFTSAGSPDRKSEADGGVSFKPVYPHFQHGYGTSNYPAKAIPNPSDIRAVFSAIDMKLVLADTSKPDDRAVAKYVVDTGADYYPDATYKMWSLGYAPGVGNGRYLLANTNWRTATLLVPNKDLGATYDEIRANPPPMN